MEPIEILSGGMSTIQVGLFIAGVVIGALIIIFVVCNCATI